MRQSVLVRVNPNRDSGRRKAWLDMRHISGDIYGLLMRQGLGAGRGGAQSAHGMKGPASRTDALSGEVKADAREGFEYRPTAVRGDTHSRYVMGKDRGNVTPAKSTGLRLVSSRCLGTAFPTRLPHAAVSKHLVLVVSR